jgi:predicted TIM-barrel fold metal-dependent hydrolase
VPIYDSDAHISEPEDIFTDAYLDPAFRARRPQVVGIEGRAHWVIDSQLYPRWTGRGCHIMGTPTRLHGQASRFAATKPESLESLELSDPQARLRDMDREGLDVQVIYPSLFLYQPLSSDPALLGALQRSYHNYLADKLGREERLRWVATVALTDPAEAAREVRRTAELGACGVMIGGTAGDRPLNDPSVAPFWDAVAEAKLPVGVHVLWCWEPLTNFYDQIMFSSALGFVLPVLMGFAAVVAGGVLDRYPDLKVGFFEAGCLWLHFLTDRLNHRFDNNRALQQATNVLAALARQPAGEYLKTGRVFINCEVEDPLLPQVIELIGADQILFASDMPHNDREPFAARALQRREDIPAAAKRKILWDNSVRFYGR